jgi:SAM-dependent methyltransferase/Flp pilus assembly protein TadD
MVQTEAGLQGLLEEAVRHHRAGRLGEAERLYREILAADAGHSDSLHLLGMLAHQVGRNDVALDLMGQALAIDSEIALYHANLGIVLKHVGRNAEASAAYRAALRLHPADARTQSNLAAALLDMGLAEEGRGAAEVAVRLEPDLAEAYSNLGNALKMLGRPVEALDACRIAIRLNPGLLAAYDNLGTVLFDLGRIEEAIAIYDAALCLDPGRADAWANRGAALLALDRILPAYISACWSLRLFEQLKAKLVFGECMKRLSFTECPDDVRGWMARALSEPWGRPKDLARSAMRQVRANPAFAGLLEMPGPGWSERQLDQALAVLQSDLLLLTLMRVSVVPDYGLEQVLTACRAALLKRVRQANGLRLASDLAMTFVCALAQQCFINEYVFSVSDEEREAVEGLQQSIEGFLERGEATPVEALVLLACYVPLHRLPAAGRLLDRVWTGSVEQMLTQQVREPLAERQLATRIHRLNEVEDRTSLEVRQQYEENPYPRWVGMGPMEAAPSLDHYIQSTFHSPHYRPQRRAHPDILIAGCGTGQHPIQTARQFPYAKLLAVDLSLASLAYAQRKADEAGITNVEFAQADLLRLGELGQQFDVIESVGVLHHLRDPLAGMRVLTSLLRPGGVFRLGLYSELARQSVVAIRDFIAQRQIGSGVGDIRRCRQELVALEDGDMRKKVVTYTDFFATSDCRDLLFHVQEHRVSIPEIGSWLEELGLTFIGFDVRPEVAKGFRLKFPDPGAEMDLGLWHRFEEANPSTFGRMYQFWVQKAPV